MFKTLLLFIHILSASCSVTYSNLVGLLFKKKQKKQQQQLEAPNAGRWSTETIFYLWVNLFTATVIMTQARRER